MKIIDRLIGIIAPHECLGCRSEGGLLCGSCLNDLQKVPQRCYVCRRVSPGFRTCESCRSKAPLDSLAVAAVYEGLPKELVQLLKFSRAAAAAEVAAAAIAQVLPAEIAGGAVISHIPTAPARVRERGYDQAALIAKSLARQIGQPYSPLLLRMGAHRQLGQNREARLKQMEGAFRPIKVGRYRDKRVLLVDDVFTTGATCESAARTLRQAGFSRVSVAVFAVA